MSNNTVSSDELEEIRKRVRSMMSEKRYLHTLGVEREIIRLSEIFLPEKREKLRAAALLHDITKEYSPEKQAELCEKYSIEVSDSMKRSPKLYHAVTGAYIAKTLFPEAVDNELFDAITYHTTGRCAMTMADKLLYLATISRIPELLTTVLNSESISMTALKKRRHMKKNIRICRKRSCFHLI